MFSTTLSRGFFFATSTTWLRFEDFTNGVGAIHTSDMTQPLKTLYFNTLYYVDVDVCAILLYCRKTPNACLSEDVIVQISAIYKNTGNMRDIYKQILATSDFQTDVVVGIYAGP